jgi:hypothetical protein
MLGWLSKEVGGCHEVWASLWIILSSILTTRLFLSDFTVALLLGESILVGRKCELFGDAQRFDRSGLLTQLVRLLYLSIIGLLGQAEHFFFTARKRRRCLLEFLVLLDLLSFRGDRYA